MLLPVAENDKIVYCRLQRTSFRDQNSKLPLADDEIDEVLVSKLLNFPSSQLEIFG